MPNSIVKLSAELGDRFHTTISCGHSFVIDQPKPMGRNEGPNPWRFFSLPWAPASAPSAASSPSRRSCP